MQIGNNAPDFTLKDSEETIGICPNISAKQSFYFFIRETIRPSAQSSCVRCVIIGTIIKNPGATIIGISTDSVAVA